MSIVNALILMFMSSFTFLLFGSVLSFTVLMLDPIIPYVYVSSKELLNETQSMQGRDFKTKR